MTAIRPSSDLRNRYNEIFEFCNKYNVENYMIFYIVNEKEKNVSVVRVLSGRHEWHNII